MKRFLIVTSFAAALCVIPVLSTASADQGGNASNQFCKDLAENNPVVFDANFTSHGDCVSRFQSASATAQFCQDNFDAAGFASVGDCVSFFRSNN